MTTREREKGAYNRPVNREEDCSQKKGGTSPKTKSVLAIRVSTNRTWEAKSMRWGTWAIGSGPEGFFFRRRRPGDAKTRDSGTGITVSLDRPVLLLAFSEVRFASVFLFLNNCLADTFFEVSLNAARTKRR